MTSSLTARDRLYLVVSILMVLLGLVMLLRLRLAWDMVMGWAIAVGFVGVGAYRLRVAFKAIRKLRSG